MIQPFSFWVNRKTGDLYRVNAVDVVNCTNAQDGQRMVEYRRYDQRVVDCVGDTYVRETTEFLVKFKPEGT